MGNVAVLLLAIAIVACGGASVVSGRGAGACIRGVLLAGYGAVLVFALLVREGAPAAYAQAMAAVFLLVLLATVILLASIQMAVTRGSNTDASERKRLKG